MLVVVHTYIILLIFFSHTHAHMLLDNINILEREGEIKRKASRYIIFFSFYISFGFLFDLYKIKTFFRVRRYKRKNIVFVIFGSFETIRIYYFDIYL